jgi:hypothetical protein
MQAQCRLAGACRLAQHAVMPTLMRMPAWGMFDSLTGMVPLKKKKNHSYLST